MVYDRLERYIIYDYQINRHIKLSNKCEMLWKDAYPPSIKK